MTEHAQTKPAQPRGPVPDRDELAKAAITGAAMYPKIEPRDHAKVAYAIADAMIAESKKPPT